MFVLYIYISYIDELFGGNPGDCCCWGNMVLRRTFNINQYDIAFGNISAIRKYESSKYCL